MASTTVARPFSLFDPFSLSSSGSTSYKSSGNKPHYRKQSEILTPRPTSFYHRTLSFTSASPPRAISPDPLISPHCLPLSSRPAMGVKDAFRSRRASNTKMQPPESLLSRGPLAAVDNIEAIAIHDALKEEEREKPKKSIKKQRSMPLLLSLKGRGHGLSKAKAGSAAPSGSPDSADFFSSPQMSDLELPEIEIGEVEVRPEHVFEEKRHFSTRRGMKHHPYTSEDAPYMQAYDPILLENDRSTDSLLRRVNPTGTPSFYDYGKRAPSKVLDLGCGEGRWVMEAAITWKSSGTKVTGFDLVDIHGDSTAWAFDKAAAENVTWVRGNFVKYKLPFPDASFDFVRMANLSLCIPYDRWSFVLGEVYRVLIPAGRLELIDDQIYFPYEKSIAKTPSAPSPSHRRSTTSSAFEPDSDDEVIEVEVEAATPSDVPELHRDDTVEDDKAQEITVGPDLSADLSAEWDAGAENCKGLETLFEQMLQRKYRIHPRPHTVFPRFLQAIFGESNFMKTHSMHLALAPRDQGGGGGSVSSRDSDTASLLSTDTAGKKSIASSKESKNWMTIEWDKREKNREKPSKGERTSGESFTSASQIPETLSAKAAGRLGITPAPDTHIPETLSAKAAGRLGIKPASRPPYRQSPGLLLWPSTFISVPPAELEMHACKNVHQLLGCKAALADYIAELKDENGERLVGNEGIEEAFWDYECFRRKRFSWPADLPALRMVEQLNDPAPKSATFRTSGSSDTPSFFGRPRSGSGSNPTDSPAPNSKYLFRELTFVRTLRVYEAYKIDHTVVC